MIRVSAADPGTGGSIRTRHHLSRKAHANQPQVHESPWVTMSHQADPIRSTQSWPMLTKSSHSISFPTSPTVYWSLLCLLCFVNTFMTRRTCCDFSDLRATSACFLAALSSTESGVWKVVYDSTICIGQLRGWHRLWISSESHAKTRLRSSINVVWSACSISLFGRESHTVGMKQTKTSQLSTMQIRNGSKWFEMVRN